jgi:hypothetical protein
MPLRLGPPGTQISVALHAPVPHFVRDGVAGAVELGDDEHAATMLSNKANARIPKTTSGSGAQG